MSIYMKFDNSEWQKIKISGFKNEEQALKFYRVIINNIKNESK